MWQHDFYTQHHVGAFVSFSLWDKSDQSINQSINQSRWLLWSFGLSNCRRAETWQCCAKLYGTNKLIMVFLLQEWLNEFVAISPISPRIQGPQYICTFRGRTWEYSLAELPAWPRADPHIFWDFPVLSCSCFILPVLFFSPFYAVPVLFGTVTFYSDWKFA